MALCISDVYCTTLQGRSTESTESGNSIHHYSTLEVSEATKQRVGSFRSRLRKQQPISMPEPPVSHAGSKTSSRQPSDHSNQASTEHQASTENNFPYVSVTVHDVIDPSKEISDL